MLIVFNFSITIYFIPSQLQTIYKLKRSMASWRSTVCKYLSLKTQVMKKEVHKFMKIIILMTFMTSKLDPNMDCLLPVRFPTHSKYFGFDTSAKRRER